MAIFIKDENYKELSKIFLKNIEDYKQICKVYICTGPNQYELLFDGCADIFCDGTEDGECSDCRVRWLSIYDDLLLGTNGPTPEGISKIICPLETCNFGIGLTTTCSEDEICCNCDAVPPIPENYEKCESIIDINCPCLELDTDRCTNLPSYLNNVCKVYAWTALGGLLQQDGLCDSCAIPERTEISQCCINGKKYSYIKKVTWNNDPIDKSNCGIKKNCQTYLFDKYYYEEIISEGGIAAEPKLYVCTKDNCNVCEPACCSNQAECLTDCNIADWCRFILCDDGGQGDRCRQYWFETRPNQSICDFCGPYMTEEDDPCNCFPDPPCPQEPDGECPACDTCVENPCSLFCANNCENVDICAEICGPPINWLCAMKIAGNNYSEYIDLLKQCGCGPDPDSCDEICYG